jgi:FG-GAP-like repeat
MDMGTSSWKRTLVPRDKRCKSGALEPPAVSVGAPRHAELGADLGDEIGIGPHALHLGDLNRDGKVDIVTADETEGNMSTLLNTGNGTFGARKVTVTGALSDFGLGDFDGDGVLDLAAPLPLNNGIQQPLSTAQVMKGRADGTFGSAGFIPTLAGAEMTDLVVGELSGDGKPDAVMAYIGGIAVLLNQGAGAFSRTEFATGPNATLLALADFGGNTALDIAVADTFTGLITFFINQGNGTFVAASPPTQSGAYAFRFVTADANGDGKPDLAFVSYVYDTLTVLLNDGSGGFSSRTYAAPGRPDRVVAGDLNGDGRVDLVVSSWSTAGVQVYTNLGDGTFGTPAVYAAGPVQAVTLADVTGDGKTDILVAGSSGMSVGVLANTGAGFAALTGSGTADNLPTGQTLGIGDLNGDGLPDAVNGGRGILVVFPNIGGAKFGAGVVYPASMNAAFPKIVDLDGDKRPDVLALSDYGVDVFLNTRCTGP